MKNKARTALTIRVQARGGKFLGDDVGGASVVVRDATTSEVLASGITRGDSGTVCPAYQAGASLAAIVTPGKKKPTVSWVVAGEATSKLVAELALERPTPIEVTALGPLGGLQSAHRATAVQTIVPDQPDPEPGWVIELPGLMVQVLEPPTHQKLAAGGGTVPLRANVTMMCGCQIERGSTWIPKDFEVAAVVRKAGSRRRIRVPLTFARSGTPSLFHGEVEVDEPGDYEAAISAVQKSTGNSGAGLVTFIVPAA